MYPMAVVGTAGRQVIIYQLENQPSEFKRIESPLKYQVNFLHLLCETYLSIFMITLKEPMCEDI